MAARVEVKSLVIADELDVWMRRVGSRLAKLAAGAPAGGAKAIAALAAASASLARYQMSLVPVADAAAEALRALAPGGVPADAAADVLDACLARAAAGDSTALDAAGAWAKAIAAQDTPEPGSAAVLARYAAVAGDAEAGRVAARMAGLVTVTDAIGPAIAKARALAAVRTEESVAAARSIHEALDRDTIAPGGAVGRTSDPATQAAWLELSRDLYLADRHVRYLDAVESATLNQVLFQVSDDGGGIVGRTLESDAGRVDDEIATPAAAGALAAAAQSSLFVDSDGSLVASQAVNAAAELVIGGRASMRCLVSTQLPARGWSCWSFEPKLAAVESAPVVATTRRTGRQRAVVQQPAQSAATAAQAERLTFSFSVRVPKWAADNKVPPFVKIDGERANVQRSRGFLTFDVATDRETKIEVTFSMGAAILERGSAVSWAREVAITYGPILLTATAQYNPSEDLGLPMRITSTLEELELIADIRRRLPVLQAKALSGGGRLARVLFTPVSEIGGYTDGIGGTQQVRCVPFRTWNRWGR